MRPPKLPGPKSEARIVDQFHKLYYLSGLLGRTWKNTYWLGVPAQKCPLDLWVYQEIVFEIRPDIIIECGTADGGTALFLSSLCEMLNRGRIITIDIAENKQRPDHARIIYLVGSSTSKRVVDEIRSLIKVDDRVMVILDSDHSKEHVLSELRVYGKLVSKGSYLIVEDTNVNNHPVLGDFGPGPMEAAAEFLAEDDAFVADRSREKFYLTFNPGGYLQKRK